MKSASLILLVILLFSPAVSAQGLGQYVDGVGQLQLYLYRAPEVVGQVIQGILFRAFLAQFHPVFAFPFHPYRFEGCAFIGRLVCEVPDAILVLVLVNVFRDRGGRGSKYSNEQTAPGGRERALNTFVIKVEPISEKRCRVLAINYADLAGIAPTAINNLINTKYFLPPLYRRITKAMSASRSAQ